MEGKEVDLHTQPGADELRRGQWFTLGALVRKRVYKPLAVQLELNYLREGGSFKGYTFLGKTVYTIDCLQIPLLLDLKLPVSERLSLHLQGGLAFVAVLKGVELDMPSYAPQNKFSNPSSFFSQVYSAELAWPRGRQIYFFNARFTQDQTNFYQRAYFGTHYNARSNVVSLTVGTLFGQ